MDEKKSILYVDDEDMNLMLFEEVFSEWFNVIIAESGFSGIEKLKQNPDIKSVISDMKMPIMNGLEFITKARTNFPDKEYYILTGFDIDQKISEALNQKIIIKYFQKPLNVNDILESLLDCEPDIS
jgi:two-component system, response regulator, stage 0 sporulation protein F